MEEVLYYNTKIEPKDVKEVLFDFLKNKKVPKTYFNKEMSEIQCYEHKNRSIDDLMSIVKGFFPEVTVEDVMKGIIDIFNEIKEKNKTSGTAYWDINLMFFFCTDIYKPVIMIGHYSYNDTRGSRELFRNGHEQYNYKGKSKYSMAELVEIYDKLTS